jgi:nucleotide-binding universal stress UspA family protein
MRRVLCSVDDSPAAADVISVAMSLADALDCHLVLFHAVSQTGRAAAPVMPYGYAYVDEVDREALREAGEHFLERLARDFRVPATTDRRVELGEASNVLPGVAEELAADLVVVGTRGRGPWAAAILGSVSSAAMSDTPRPVVVVPPGARLEPGPVVCAVDETPAARRAARLARVLAEELGAELVLAHAVSIAPVPSLSAVPTAHAALVNSERQQAAGLLDALARDEAPGTAVDRRVVHGTPAEAICALAEEERANLVVIGTRGRGTVMSAVGGSVSREVVRMSVRPVVVVD